MPAPHDADARVHVAAMDDRARERVGLLLGRLGNDLSAYGYDDLTIHRLLLRLAASSTQVRELGLRARMLARACLAAGLDARTTQAWTAELLRVEPVSDDVVGALCRPDALFPSPEPATEQQERQERRVGATLPSLRRLPRLRPIRARVPTPGPVLREVALRDISA